MAKKKDTAFFENKLLDFVTAEDPMLEMLQWVMDKFMEIEVAHRTGAEKGVHSQSRTGVVMGAVCHGKGIVFFPHPSTT